LAAARHPHARRRTQASVPARTTPRRLERDRRARPIVARNAQHALLDADTRVADGASWGKVRASWLRSASVMTSFRAWISIPIPFALCQGAEKSHAWLHGIRPDRRPVTRSTRTACGAGCRRSGGSSSLARTKARPSGATRPGRRLTLERSRTTYELERPFAVPPPRPANLQRTLNLRVRSISHPDGGGGRRWRRTSIATSPTVPAESAPRPPRLARSCACNSNCHLVLEFPRVDTCRPEELAVEPDDGASLHARERSARRASKSSIRPG